MAKTVICCLFDDKLGMFNSPMSFASIGMASRSFETEANRDAPDNAIFSHPEDFSIYHVANFDPETALFEQLSPPVLIHRAQDVKTV